MNKLTFIGVIVTAVCFLGGCSKSGMAPNMQLNETPNPSPTIDAALSQHKTSPSPSSGNDEADVLPQKSPPTPIVTAEAAPTPGRAAFPNIPIDHLVVVIEENHAYSQIMGTGKAPFIDRIAKQGALLTNAYGVTHPSQPNYFALFAGSAGFVKDDSCKGPFEQDNLATELSQAGFSFIGYSENMPKAGFTGCSAGNSYARKHNPWAQFSNVPKEQNQPLSAFPSDYAKLPTVSFIVPALENDMHDGSIQEADRWLEKQVGGYLQWAQTHRSLLIVTWDEDDTGHDNHIPLIVTGPMIKPGVYSEKVNHYDVLRTIEDLWGLHALGESKDAEGLPRDIWDTSG